MPKSFFSFKPWSRLLFNFLFPPFCPGCEDYTGIQADPQALCGTCLKKLREAIRDYPHWAAQCAGLDGLWSLAPYGSAPLTTLIHKMKYQSKDWIVHTLKPALSQGLDGAQMKEIIDWIVPVPLHWWREKQRGFNQAQIIAGAVSELISRPVEERLLKKIKHTAAQVKISNNRKRRLNIRGSIAAGEKAAQAKGKRILLVDDVYTTGATMQECAGVLKRLGAVKIFGFTLARGSL